MAAFDKTIGAVDRHYPTITIWDANDGGGDGLGNDDCTGSVYNDSGALSETPTISFNANSITLTVAEAERHDGTFGTGVQVENAATVITAAVESGAVPVVIEWLEIDLLTPGAHDAQGIYATGNDTTIRNCIVRGDRTQSTYRQTGIQFSGTVGEITWIYNNIVYHCQRDYSRGFDLYGKNNHRYCYNNISYGNNRNIYAQTRDSNTLEVRNNICMGHTGRGDYAMAGGTTGDFSYNMSSDDTGEDFGATNSLINKTAADQFVSVGPPDAEDFHLKDTNADSYEAGIGPSAEGNCPTDDIDGDTRSGATCDMGADEYSAAPPAGHPTMARWRHVPGLHNYTRSAG